MAEYRKQIELYLDTEKKILDSISPETVEEVMNVLETARKERHRVFVCGNGGSYATASHMVGDFNMGISIHKKVKYDFECLSDNLPTMMSIANDFDYADIFAVPLQNKLRPGDVVIGISGSGNSENVIRAIEYANRNGAETIGLTGYDGGKLKQIVKHGVHIAIDNMQIVEDVHLILNHMMMYILSHEEE